LHVCAYAGCHLYFAGVNCHCCLLAGELLHSCTYIHLIYTPFPCSLGLLVI